MTTFEDITYKLADGFVRIAVNRPDKLNAYRNQTADELREAIALAEAEGTARAILMTGEGRAFGSGYDLSTVRPDEVPALDDVLERHFNPLVHAMRHSRLPIVAAINGPCAGAAVGIALAADIVLAGRSSYFYEPFVGIALVPDAGNTIFLSRMLGRIRASGMMLLGDRISAEKALQWGLLWEVVDDAEVESAAAAICARLAQLEPQALASTKRLIADAADFAMAEQLDLERDLQGEAGRSPAMKAKIAAFFARQKG
ncbi:enoyl-CoA hydratase-related protein [Pseudorhodoplanes sp.]|uniref:enoyl-CoA hydratase-related protein n=1 Tax=Pseudorhodoplanes sp. TaxID=1934341 RepID=UPI002C2BE558|nr:enoyl-CoA hydratase-related protein [Pseudorhodoplanes sp.]HWK68896.1 enoyl-CoA hydratase-related protein [Rhizobiaceae bacterium]HWV41025.1 enoyl-CoA hydratase-related protein [Pseudorhodoplanes sp.]